MWQHYQTAEGICLMWQVLCMCLCMVWWATLHVRSELMVNLNSHISLGANLQITKSMVVNLQMLLVAYTWRKSQRIMNFISTVQVTLSLCYFEMHRSIVVPSWSLGTFCHNATEIHHGVVVMLYACTQLWTLPFALLRGSLGITHDAINTLQWLCHNKKIAIEKKKMALWTLSIHDSWWSYYCCDMIIAIVIHSSIVKNYCD